MKIYNILWLKFLNCSVKQHRFYLTKISLHTASFSPCFFNCKCALLTTSLSSMGCLLGETVYFSQYCKVCCFPSPMKLASGFCIPEPHPVHTGIKRRHVRPLIRFYAEEQRRVPCNQRWFKIVAWGHKVSVPSIRRSLRVML